MWVVLPGKQEQFSLRRGKPAQRVPCALPLGPGAGGLGRAPPTFLLQAGLEEALRRLCQG